MIYLPIETQTIMKALLSKSTVKVVREGNWIRVVAPDGNSYGRHHQFQKMTEEQIVDYIIAEQNDVITRNNEDEKIKDSFKGQTPEQVQQNPNFAYARFRDYGITVYARSNNSPTGVFSVTSFDNSEMNKFKALLSPTEDLRTAH